MLGNIEQNRSAVKSAFPKAAPSPPQGETFEIHDGGPAAL